MVEHLVNDALTRGAAPGITSRRFSSGSWRSEGVSVPREMGLTVYINGEELLTILCTPIKLNELVLGYLYSGGIISGMDDVAYIRLCEDESMADVRLATSGYTPPVRRTLATGCGGGISFPTEYSKIASDLRVSPDTVLALMKQLNEQAELYRQCGGVHASALADETGVIAIAEDVGRHNTLDKIMGECLLNGISTRDKLLLTTGRISSEMLSKALMMGTPIVVSRSTPTDRSIALAGDFGLTLVGYARGNRLSVYSHEERLQGALNQG